MSNQPTRLTSDDWSDILPITDFKIGKTVLMLQPLGLESLSKFALNIKAVFESAGKDGVTVENLQTPEGMASIFKAAAEHAPALLEMATGLHRDDIRRLPIATGVSLMRAVLQINIESQESLSKNLRALGEMLGLIPAQIMADGE